MTTISLIDTKNSTENVAITGNLNAKHTDFNCSIRDKNGWYCIAKRTLLGTSVT